jgi:hypothetical protein
VREAFNHAWPASSLRERDGDGLVGLAGAALSLAAGESYRIEAPFRGFAVDTLGPAEDAPGLDLPGPLQATDLAQVGPLVLRSYTPPPEFDGAAASRPHPARDQPPAGGGPALGAAGHPLPGTGG